MTAYITETSYDRAWRVIRAMQTKAELEDIIIVCRISCYLKKAEIHEKIQQYDYTYKVSPIKTLRKPFPFNFLPIPSPNYFYLYDAGLYHIYDLASACNDFLMFEILFTDRKSSRLIKETTLASSNTLYDDFLPIRTQFKRYFFCGFDFDDPFFKSGISQALRYNFVPDCLSVYFQNW